MPVYDYECTVCQRSFVHEASIHAPTLTSAPDCANENCNVRRCLTSFAGVVKTSGASSARELTAAPPEVKPAYMTDSPAHTCSKYCSHHS